MQILIAVDELDTAETLAEFVVNHNWEPGTNFAVVHAIAPLPIGMALPADLLHAIADERYTEGRQIVRHAALKIRDAFKTAHVAEEIVVGNAKEKLLDMASDLGADLILLSSHAKKALDRLVIGSVSQTVFTNAPCAVMIIRPAVKRVSAKAAPRSRWGATRIIVAIDDSIYSQWVIDTIVKRHWAPYTEFKVLSVVEPIAESDGNGKTAAINHKRKLHAEQLCQKAMRKITEHVADSIVHCEIREGDPGDEIVAASNEWSANKILMGAHSKDICPHNMMGSVSKKVTDLSFCSVEIIKPLLAIGSAKK